MTRRTTLTENIVLTEDIRVQRRAQALVQHQRVMEEAATIARIAEQARRRAAASPVFASTKNDPDLVRSRVDWTPKPTNS